MGQHPDADLAHLAVVMARAQRRAEVALEHAEDGFDLPALAVGFLGEAPMHLSAVVAAEGSRLAVGARPAALGGGDDAADAPLITAQPMKRRFRPKKPMSHRKKQRKLPLKSRARL